MEIDDLIEAIRRKAQDPSKRTDFAERSRRPIAVKLSAEAIAEAERRLGFALHPLHRRLFEEIGNGGFGPGAGLIGLPGGHTDETGNSLIELRTMFGVDVEHYGLPHGVTPLCNLGSGRWACIDDLDEEGTVLVLDIHGLIDTGVSLRTWLTNWLSGVSTNESMFDFVEQAGTNPFTRQPTIFRSPSRAKGKPYVPRR
jgi:SMI1-KNR4 cell-wall